MFNFIDPARFEITYSARRLGRKPETRALIRGSDEYPGIRGLVLFSPQGRGTWVDVEVEGLPPFRPAEGGSPQIGPFGFHLHEGGQCEPMGGGEPFSGARGHYNPDNQPHGNHAGDFPVLFSNAGRAHMSFYTDRFAPSEIIGKTVIIHQGPDDYKTQPAGGSGVRIACGEVGRA